MTANGEYIVDRLLPGMVRQACSELGFSVETFSDDWVIEIKNGKRIRRIIGYIFDINSAAASALAADKVAAYQILTANGIAAVPHQLLRTKVGQVGNVAGQDKVVVKPLTGTSGHGVRLLAPDAIMHYVSQSGIEAWAISPYVAIKKEIRLVVLDGALLLAYEKIPVTSDTELVMFNLGKGAVPRDYTPDDELVQLAAGAQAALGLRLAAVDCVELASGERLVLEINSGFMMEHYVRTSPEHEQCAYELYQQIVEVMMVER